MADRIALNRTNTELLAANIRRQAQRTGIAYDDQGTCVKSLEDIKERRQLAENKRKYKEAKSWRKKKNNQYFFQLSKNLMRLRPDPIYGLNHHIPSKNTKNPGSPTRNKKLEDKVLINTFQDLLRIEL